MTYAIGVDSGTQGTKVVVIDFSGRVLGRGNAPHRFVEGLKPGESEQDPSVWVEALDKALIEALKASQIDASKVKALGVSGQQHGCVPLDAEGQPVRPAKLWNDTATVPELEQIVAALGGKEKCIAKLGILPAVGYTASKILWLRIHEPDHYQKTAAILLPHNYLNSVLTGKLHMEYGDASGTGLMDIRNLVWHEEALAAVDPELETKLPPLSHPSESVGYVKEDIAQRFGLKKVLVASGGGDNMMGAVGTGNVSPGVCTLSLGTSGTIYSYFPEPFIDPEGEIAAFCDSTGGWLPLLCTMNVTNTTEHLKSLLDISNEEMEELAQKAKPGAEGLIFLPFIDGERVPVLPHANGVLFGLNRVNFNAPHITRAVMEGTILNLGYGYARMKALGLEPSEIRVTGGGARSRLWRQVSADILETPVKTLKEQEAAAFGAAIQAIWCLRRTQGESIQIREITEQTVKLDACASLPIKEHGVLYQRVQERFNSLWIVLKNEFQKH